MATPRPMDQARANPVLYREKGNLSSRLNSARSLTARAQTTQEQTNEDNDSNRQAIVFNIPQQTRDDDDKTEKSWLDSRTNSIATLDQTPTDGVLNRDEPHALTSSAVTNSGLSATMAENDEPHSQDTLEQAPIVINDHLERHEGAQSDQQFETEQQRHDPTDASNTDGVVAHAHDARESVDLLDRVSDGRKSAIQSITADELSDYNCEQNSVPCIDDEIEAVLRAQHHGGVFDLTQSVDSVDFELARRNAQAMQSGVAQPTDGHSVSDDGAVLRGKTCTPASLYTDVSELKYRGDDRSSQGPETKEAMFQQALTLMDERCVSRDSSRIMAQIDHRYTYTPPGGQPPNYTRSTTDASVVATRDNVETPLVGLKHHPYGANRPNYFYVHQRKPTPMEPLPAWKGYYGNVYFSPISVQPAKAVPHPPHPAPDLQQCSEQLQQILTRGRRTRSKSVGSKRATDLASSSTTSNARSSATSRKSARSGVKRSQSMLSVKSSAFSKSSNASRQMSLLDKRSVLSNFNENIEEDFEWIQGIESTGSLTVLQNDINPVEQRRSTVTFEKDKICKGTSLRRSHSAKYTNTPLYPELQVRGGHCEKPSKDSQAVLRARPHYPFFHQNRHMPSGPTNSGIFSPQSYNGFLGSFDSLPPLEQLRASLRRMESSASKDELINTIPPTNRKLQSTDMKRSPHVKFSPEFKYPQRPPRNIIVK